MPGKPSLPTPLIKKPSKNHVAPKDARPTSLAATTPSPHKPHAHLRVHHRLPVVRHQPNHRRVPVLFWGRGGRGGQGAGRKAWGRGGGQRSGWGRGQGGRWRVRVCACVWNGGGGVAIGQDGSTTLCLIRPGTPFQTTSLPPNMHARLVQGSAHGRGEEPACQAPSPAHGRAQGGA